ncbi:MAG: hypothetical protein LPK19_10170, partial [Hymenobacteraceae bacterium]|nr:hypothetical protein [Hymenobacteraceae bacterium]MDX5396589.1 hypothetical protein [Hymenobacteraceae bacterium]MDX5512652.1 hypothetical protein [Hymenobacteraceae bacterium]
KDLAAAIANDIVDKVDAINQQLTFENRQKALALYQTRYEFMAQDYQKLRDSLQTLRRKFGIFDMGHQGHNTSRALTEELIQTEKELQSARAELEVLARNYYATHEKVIDQKAKVTGLEKAYNSLTGATKGNLITYDSYVNGADVIDNLVYQLHEMNGPYVKAKMNYDNAKLALSQKMSTLYIVQKAMPATKKSKPVRWLIVVASTFMTFFLSVVLISFYELYKRQFALSEA